MVPPPETTRLLAALHKGRHLGPRLAIHSDSLDKFLLFGRSPSALKSICRIAAAHMNANRTIRTTWNASCKMPPQLFIELGLYVVLSVIQKPGKIGLFQIVLLWYDDVPLSELYNTPFHVREMTALHCIPS